MKQWAGFMSASLLLMMIPTAVSAQEVESQERELTEEEQRVEDFLNAEDTIDRSSIGITGELTFDIVSFDNTSDKSEAKKLNVSLVMANGSYLMKDKNDDTVYGRLIQRIYLDEKQTGEFVVDLYKRTCPDNEDEVDFFIRFDEGEWWSMEGVDVVTGDETYQFFDTILDEEDMARYFQELTEYEIFEYPDQSGAVLKSNRSLLDYKEYIDKYVEIDTVLTEEQEELLKPYLEAFVISTDYYLNYDEEVQHGCAFTIFDSDFDKVNEFLHMVSNLYYAEVEAESKNYIDLQNLWVDVLYLEHPLEIETPEEIDGAKEIEPLEVLALVAEHVM